MAGKRAAPGKLRSFLSSLRLKYLLSYLALISVIILLLNTYPILAARNLTFTSKRTTLQNQASVIVSSVSALDNLTGDTVHQVLRLLKVDGVDRVLITDAEGVTLYDQGSRTADDTRSDWGIRRALEGNDAFYSRFFDGKFCSSASMPILSGENVTGAVYLFEEDVNQGDILLDLQHNIRIASVGIFVAAFAISILFSSTLTHRIRLLLNAIRSVREGEYSTRVEVGGSDELAGLGQEFNSLTNRLQLTEEMRRRFVSDASHELKTPLASIRLLSDSILQTPNVDTETVTEFVRDIGGEAERLARTTEKLLNLTRHDNQITIPAVRVDLSGAAEGAIQVLTPIAEAAEVTIYRDLGRDCFVLATEDDIYQIVINLVENAVKYNVRGGRVSLRSVRQEGSVVLTVTDTGIGIPEASLPNIFDRFYRVDKARSRETGGSGLGLSIVKSTVEEHHGTVTASRRPQGGMVFTVVFPYCAEEDTAKSPE